MNLFSVSLFVSLRFYVSIQIFRVDSKILVHIKSMVQMIWMIYITYKISKIKGKNQIPSWLLFFIFFKHAIEWNPWTMLLFSFVWKIQLLNAPCRVLSHSLLFSLSFFLFFVRYSFSICWSVDSSMFKSLPKVKCFWCWFGRSSTIRV